MPKIPIGSTKSMGNYMLNPPDDDYVDVPYCPEHPRCEMEYDTLALSWYCHVCRSIEQGAEDEVCQSCGESLIGNNGDILTICPKCQQGMNEDDSREER